MRFNIISQYELKVKIGDLLWAREKALFSVLSGFFFSFLWNCILLTKNVGCLIQIWSEPEQWIWSFEHQLCIVTFHISSLWMFNYCCTKISGKGYLCTELPNCKFCRIQSSISQKAQGCLVTFPDLRSMISTPNMFGKITRVNGLWNLPKNWTTLLCCL